MSVQFLLDSASDILPEDAKKLGVTILPLKVRFGDTEYLDGVDLSHEAFFEKLAESKELPTTSQISPAEYAEAYEKFLEQGDDVVVISLSSRLSGTCQSAMIAAMDYPGRVFVVDSRNATLGQRILLLRGLELQKQGMGAEEIAETLTREREKIRLFAVLDTLEYLKKGGRISAATALAGSVLSIKPAVTVKDGEVVMAGKARGAHQGNILLRSLTEKCGGINFDMPWTLAYSGSDDSRLQKFREDCGDLWQEAQEVPVATVGAAIGTHVGPSAWAVVFFEK